MPSNYTKNYHLSQWEPEDQVLRTDFNADNLAIDEALKGQADAVTAEKAAREAAITAETKARTEADTSINSALTHKGNCSIGFFTYTGTGASPTIINFPRKPFAFITSGFGGGIMGWGGQNKAHLVSGGTETATWSGNQFQMPFTADPQYRGNGKNTTYHVTVFYAED